MYAIDDRAQHAREAASRRPTAAPSTTRLRRTIARNTGTGCAIRVATSVAAARSSPNNRRQLRRPAPTNGGGNLESAATCGFGAAGSNKDPRLDTALTDQGGQRRADASRGSPAIGIVAAVPSRSTSAAASACRTAATRATRARTRAVPLAAASGRRPRRRRRRRRPRRRCRSRTSTGTAPRAPCSSRRPAASSSRSIPSKPIPHGATIDTKDGTITLTAAAEAGRQAADGEVLRRHLQAHAAQDDDRPHAQPRRWRSARRSRRTRRRPNKKKPKTRKLWGERVRLVPHPRPIQRRDRPRHRMARPGLLRRHAHPREEGRRRRARQRQAQDDHPARGQAVSGEAEER